jgi:hypothetical protein
MTWQQAHLVSQSLKYEIKWEGYEEVTFEPEENLIPYAKTF